MNWNWLESFWRSLTIVVPGATRSSVHWHVASHAQKPTGSNESVGNFTPRAQQALALARKEADRFNHNFVGTEHLLLGLIALGQGVAVTVLKKLGLDLETVRLEVEKPVGIGPDRTMTGNIPYTPRVKKVLALAAKEAAALQHTYVGTEHMLVGLLREGDGTAARVLKNLDVSVEETRNEMLKGPGAVSLSPRSHGRVQAFDDSLHTTEAAGIADFQIATRYANQSTPASDTTSSARIGARASRYIAMPASKASSTCCTVNRTIRSRSTWNSNRATARSSSSPDRRSSGSANTFPGRDQRVPPARSRRAH